MEKVINNLLFELKKYKIDFKQDNNIFQLQYNDKLINNLKFIIKNLNISNILLLYKNKIDKNEYMLPSIFFSNDKLENININKYSILIIKRKENIKILKELSIPIIIIN